MGWRAVTTGVAKITDVGAPKVRERVWVRDAECMRWAASKCGGCAGGVGDGSEVEGKAADRDCMHPKSAESVCGRWVPQSQRTPAKGRRVRCVRRWRGVGFQACPGFLGLRFEATLGRADHRWPTKRGTC